MRWFKKSVDSILSDINENISDLKEFADEQRFLAEQERDEANELEASIAARYREARRAETVSDKLEELIA